MGVPAWYSGPEATFSKFETALQRQVLGDHDQKGFAHKTGQFIRPFLTEQHIDFFMNLALLYVGTVDESGHPLAMVLTGQPGFIHPISSTEVVIQPMQTLNAGLFEVGSKLGLLGMMSHSRRRNRLNARITRLDRDTNTLSLHVIQAFGNCPKYIQARHISVMTDQAEHGSHAAPAPQQGEGRLGKAQVELIRRSDCMFVASHLRLQDCDGKDGNMVGADVSHRGGPPGFVQIIDGGHGLQWPDFIGNYFFQTLGNITANGHVSLIFIDYAKGSTLRVAGHASIDMEDTHLPGAQRTVNVRVVKWIYEPEKLPIQQEGQVEASPYNPSSANAADRRYVRCVRITQAAVGIKSFTFAYPEPAGIGKPEPFDYLSGQYASFDIQLDGKTHNRTWTISSHPEESAEHHNFTISVKKAGLISSFLHQHLKPGSVLEWKGAAGEFVPDDGTAPVLLVAGGIGITPMRSFLLTFHKQHRPATLLYSVRAASEAAFLQELQQIEAESEGRVKLAVNVTGQDASWTGHHGRIDAQYIQEQVHNLKDYSDVYMCGPVPFMTGIEATLTSLGISGSQIHSESFAF